MDVEETVERPGLTNVSFDGQLRMCGDHQWFQCRVTCVHQLQEQVLHAEHNQCSRSKQAFYWQLRQEVYHQNVTEIPNGIISTYIKLCTHFKGKHF